jgi:hypothetical protein
MHSPREERSALAVPSIANNRENRLGLTWKGHYLITYPRLETIERASKKVRSESVLGTKPKLHPIRHVSLYLTV